MKRGSILCQKCKSTRKTRSCPKCNYDAVCIRISWNGKLYYFYKNSYGKAYSFNEAVIQLGLINQQIINKEFDPNEYLPEFINEKRFSNAFDRWLEQKEYQERDNRLSPETLRPYKSYNKNYFQDYFVSIDVRDIKLKHLQTFLDGLPEKLSAKYKKNMINCLHTFFEWLKRWGEIKELPVFPDVHVHDSKIMKPISYDEQVSAIHSIPEEHRDIFFFMRETGIRISEACAVMAKDIDFTNKRALIQRNWSGSKLQETTKGRNKEWIPLSELAIETVKKNVLNAIGNTFVFINPKTGREYRPEFLRRVWKRFSGVEATLKEAMRHSTLSDWANQGANAFQIKELARHSDIRVSDNYVKNTKLGLYNIVNRNVVKLRKRESRE